MMKTFLALCAATLIASPIVAEEAPKARFQHDGQTFEYTTRQTSAGTVIEGRRFPSGSAFRFVVRNGKVTGVSGGQTVAFTVRESRGAAGGTAVAAR